MRPISSTSSTSSTQKFVKSIQTVSNSTSSIPHHISPNPKSSQYIEDSKNFFHKETKTKPNQITSFNKKNKGHFENKYKSHKWTFIKNYREKELPVFANEVTAYQYKIIAQKQGFYGELPQLIKRKNVENNETLDLTKGKEGDELLNIFFEKTPNGKSTKRIMDDFGLRATAVRRGTDSYLKRFLQEPFLVADFYIDVESVNSKLTTK